VIETDADLEAGPRRKVASGEMNAVPSAKQQAAVMVVVPIEFAFQERSFRGRALSSLRLSCRFQDLSTTQLLTALLVFCGCMDRTRKRSRGQTQ